MKNNQLRKYLKFDNVHKERLAHHKKILGNCGDHVFFDENIDIDQAIAQIKQNTRNYAKRQMTWIQRKETDAQKISYACTDEDLIRVLPN